MLTGYNSFEDEGGKKLTEEEIRDYMHGSYEKRVEKILSDIRKNHPEYDNVSDESIKDSIRNMISPSDPGSKLTDDQIAELVILGSSHPYKRAIIYGYIDESSPHITSEQMNDILEDYRKTGNGEKLFEDIKSIQMYSDSTSTGDGLQWVEYWVDGDEKNAVRFVVNHYYIEGRTEYIPYDDYLKQTASE